eukprot:TRINITY_DN19735_c0_g1_i1.p1 TRINITY_DN19735_c0_g1~~TRINITY_DN19735_c0_g1_i1.p1  ORF type:complete len:2036 (+),score=432.24 TRINITY_DN19735_c0_g1_i1:54-6161(+)
MRGLPEELDSPLKVEPLGPPEAAREVRRRGSSEVRRRVRRLDPADFSEVAQGSRELTTPEHPRPAAGGGQVNKEWVRWKGDLSASTAAHLCDSIVRLAGAPGELAEGERWVARLTTVEVDEEVQSTSSSSSSEDGFAAWKKMHAHLFEPFDNVKYERPASPVIALVKPEPGTLPVPRPLQSLHSRSRPAPTSASTVSLDPYGDGAGIRRHSEQSPGVDGGTVTVFTSHPAISSFVTPGTNSQGRTPDTAALLEATPCSSRLTERTASAARDQGEADLRSPQHSSRRRTLSPPSPRADPVLAPVGPVSCQRSRSTQGGPRLPPVSQHESSAEESPSSSDQQSSVGAEGVGSRPSRELRGLAGPFLRGLESARLAEDPDPLSPLIVVDGATVERTGSPGSTLPRRCSRSSADDLMGAMEMIGRADGEHPDSPEEHEELDRTPEKLTLFHTAASPPRRWMGSLRTAAVTVTGASSSGVASLPPAPPAPLVRLELCREPEPWGFEVGEDRLLTGVVPGSPADRAGLRRFCDGSTSVTTVNGRRLGSDGLARTNSMVLSLGLSSPGQDRSAAAILQQMIPWGVAFDDVEEEAVVAAVDEGSPADVGGLGAYIGWTVLVVEEQRVSTAKQAAAALPDGGLHATLVLRPPWAADAAVVPLAAAAIAAVACEPQRRSPLLTPHAGPTDRVVMPDVPIEMVSAPTTSYSSLPPARPGRLSPRPPSPAARRSGSPRKGPRSPTRARSLSPRTPPRTSPQRMPPRQPSPDARRRQPDPPALAAPRSPRTRRPRTLHSNRPEHPLPMEGDRGGPAAAPRSPASQSPRPAAGRPPLAPTPRSRQSSPSPAPTQRNAVPQDTPRDVPPPQLPELFDMLPPAVYDPPPPPPDEEEASREDDPLSTSHRTPAGSEGEGGSGILVSPESGRGSQASPRVGPAPMPALGCASDRSDTSTERSCGDALEEPLSAAPRRCCSPSPPIAHLAPAGYAGLRCLTGFVNRPTRSGAEESLAFEEPDSDAAPPHSPPPRPSPPSDSGWRAIQVPAIPLRPLPPRALDEEVTVEPDFPQTIATHSSPRPFRPMPVPTHAPAVEEPTGSPAAPMPVQHAGIALPADGSPDGPDDAQPDDAQPDDAQPGPEEPPPGPEEPPGPREPSPADWAAAPPTGPPSPPALPPPQWQPEVEAPPPRGDDGRPVPPEAGPAPPLAPAPAPALPPTAPPYHAAPAPPAPASPPADGPWLGNAAGELRPVLAWQSSPAPIVSALALAAALAAAPPQLRRSSTDARADARPSRRRSGEARPILHRPEQVIHSRVPAAVARRSSTSSVPTTLRSRSGPSGARNPLRHSNPNPQTRKRSAGPRSPVRHRSPVTVTPPTRRRSTTDVPATSPASRHRPQRADVALPLSSLRGAVRHGSPWGLAAMTPPGRKVEAGLPTPTSSFARLASFLTPSQGATLEPPPLGPPVRRRRRRADGKSVSEAPPPPTRDASATLSLPRSPIRINVRRTVQAYPPPLRKSASPPLRGSSASPGRVILALRQKQPWRSPPCLASHDALGCYDSKADQGSPVARTRSCSPGGNYSPSRGARSRSVVCTSSFAPLGSFSPTSASSVIGRWSVLSPSRAADSVRGIRHSANWSSSALAVTPRSRRREDTTAESRTVDDTERPPSPPCDAATAGARLHEITRELLAEPPLPWRERQRRLASVLTVLHSSAVLWHPLLHQGLLSRLLRAVARQLHDLHLPLVRQAAAVVRQLSSVLGTSAGAVFVDALFTPLLALLRSALTRFSDIGCGTLSHVVRACVPLAGVTHFVSAAKSVGAHDSRLRGLLLSLCSDLLLQAVPKSLASTVLEADVGDRPVRLTVAVPRGTTPDEIRDRYADLVGETARVAAATDPAVVIGDGLSASLDEALPLLAAILGEMLSADRDSQTAAAGCFWPCYLFHPAAATRLYGALRTPQQVLLHQHLPATPLVLAGGGLAHPRARCPVCLKYGPHQHSTSGNASFAASDATDLLDATQPVNRGLSAPAGELVVAAGAAADARHRSHSTSTLRRPATTA